MSRLIRKTFVTTAKAAVILAGAGFGMFRGLRLLDGIADNAAAVHTLKDRLDGIQSEIKALQSRNEQLQAQIEHAITADDLAKSLDKAFGRIQGGIDERFEDHARSVEALRAMVAQTDELLERLLDRLESTRNEMALQVAP